MTRVLSAFVVRDTRTARSYRLSWIMENSGIFLQLVMFYYLSRIISIPDMEGTSGEPVDPFAFIVIGISILGFLTTGIGVFARSLQAEQGTGTLEVLLTMPVSPTLSMFAMALYGFVRSLLMTFMMLVVAVIFFGVRLVTDPIALTVAFIALLGSVAVFASLGILIAAYTIVFKRGQAFMALLVQVIGLLSGVYYPVTLLPGPVQVLAELIPVTWSLNVLRQALLAGEIATMRVITLILFSIVALPISLWIFHQAVQRAKREGSLGQY